MLYWLNLYFGGWGCNHHAHSRHYSLQAITLNINWGRPLPHLCSQQHRCNTPRDSLQFPHSQLASHSLQSYSTWDSRVWLAWRWPLPFPLPNRKLAWIDLSWNGVNAMAVRGWQCALSSVSGVLSARILRAVSSRKRVSSQSIYGQLKKIM